MSSSLRLALLLVILTLGVTLTVLLTGDASDMSGAVAQLGQRVRAALTGWENQTRPADLPSPLAAASTSDRSPPLTPRAPATASNAERPRTADTRHDRPNQAAIESAPDYVIAWPDLKSRTGGNIRLTSATQDEIDTATPRGSTEIEELYVRNQDITTVLELLSRKGQRNIVASRNVKGMLSITLYNTTVDDALAAILKMQGLVARQEGDYLRVYTPEDLDEAEAQSGKIEVRIYKPRYISATDLVNILTTHLSVRGKISSTRPNQIGIAASGDNAGGDGLAVDDAIVVQDVESALARIEAIIERVDVRPPQVLIEATVLKVELNNSNQMGVNFAAFSSGNAGQSLTVSGQGSLIDKAGGFKPALLVDGLGQISDGFVDGEHGLKFGVIGGDLTAFVKLLETVGHTTLVASPKVLALNKQRAEIIVGAQLGYRTVTTTETAAVENIQFLEVGTQLRLRPFVQSDGMIRLELHPEKSSGQINADTQLPEKQTTQVTTNLTVPNGTTVVIGGLIEEQQDRQVKQVPFLGSLPWVGALFRDETTSQRRSEIIVLITPRIVDESAWDCDGLRELDDFEARRDALGRSFPPYTRTALARQHYEKACRYRDSGNLSKARVLADLSVHYDPTNAAAVRLRDELTSDTHEGMLSEPAAPAASTNSAPSTARKERRGWPTR